MLDTQHVNAKQEWASKCDKSLPNGYKNSGWFFHQLRRVVNAEKKTVSACSACLQLHMRYVAKAADTCEFSSAPRMQGKKSGKKDDKDDTNEDEDGFESDDEPTTLNAACREKGLVPVAVYDEKLLVPGAFIATNFGKKNEDWAVGSIKKNLVRDAKKMTHDVTYGDGSRGLRTLTRSQALVKESYFNEEIPVGEQRWGNWTVLCPGALKPHQTTVDETDSESEESEND